VAVEAAGIQAERRVDQRQVADVKARPARRIGVEPRPHLRRRRGAGETVVEGLHPTVEEDPLPTRDPDRQPCPNVDFFGPLSRERDLAQIDLHGSERAHLGEGALALALALEHHIAAEPQRETVERGLEGEAPPIDRRGQRQDGRLDLRAQRAERVRALRKTTHGPAKVATPGPWP
jgi:hypothetical protein